MSKHDVEVRKILYAEESVANPLKT